LDHAFSRVFCPDKPPSGPDARYSKVYSFNEHGQGVAVYRLYHNTGNVHYYTISLTERNQMLTPPTSWLDEGIAFYTYP
jgi:hypothetical protein